MKIEFELADAEGVKKDAESAQAVSVITDMRRRCCRCKKAVLGEPLALTLVDVVDSQARHDAQHAVAVAMYDAAHPGSPRSFDGEPWSTQSAWLRAAADGWSIESFSFDAIGLGLDAKVRVAGVREAKKWPAYTDRRKVFRVTSAKLPPGWLTLSFEARGSRDGKPVLHGYVMVHACPECAPAVFGAAGVDPQEPFGDGVRW